MAKVIAFVNQKGGVGKTTSSINLAASLGLLGKKTLLIDLDPQGNSTTGVGINKGEYKASIYELFVDRASLKDVVVKTNFKNLYVIPASINLAGVDMELMEMSKQDPSFVAQMQLKKQISLQRRKYQNPKQKIQNLLLLKKEKNQMLLRHQIV